MGNALKTLKEEKPDAFQNLKKSIKHWSFFRFLMIQTETNLILSNKEMMALYANLDDDTDERKVFMSKILTDYDNSFRLIEELFDEPASTRRQGQYDNIEWRNEKLKVLHHLHIKHLKAWRALNDETSNEKEKTLTKLLSIINALSSGLKNTG
ncbi:phosphoenolpyruvate carboxylase [Jejuia pallidilutea]|uniref:Phosphoenolpyruvate carboxylase n=1 Tax=Jejuia pallidilutea TaxID=504487 RepID=A0A090WME5_9FLAO|nr:phosphoenolpyruvate carboxylase [Jejuia pallidilutea]